jgi:hypothetical protein
VQKLIDYATRDLETIVAAAPYSQYHQMLLALKRNEMQKSTLYQTVLGSLPAMEIQFKKALEHVEPITPLSTDIQKKQKSTDQQNEKGDSPVNEEIITPTKDLTSLPSKIEIEEIEERLTEKFVPKEKSKKSSLIKNKKKKKSQKRKNISKEEEFTPEINDLSPFSKWLIYGDKEQSDSKVESNKKKKKSKKKKKNSKKKKKKSVSAVDTADTAQKENIEVISEPLAFLLAEQGHTKKAIAAFTKLIALFPEKQTIYVEEINKLKGS